MNRLYAVETMPTPTGARADHRLPVKPSDVEQVAREMLARVGVEVGRWGRQGSVDRRSLGGGGSALRS